MTVEKFYFADPAGGERQIFETEAEALAGADESLREYRHDSYSDGEWPSEVEGVVVGRVRLTGASEDDHEYTVTHRAEPLGNDEDGYDYGMMPVGAGS